jgi:enoyl-CoA hydratase/carnithine racemase
MTVERREGDVLCDVSDGVALVTLNRPERMNAWTRDLEGHYFDLLDELDDDLDTRAIVLTGAGRGFCPGMDMEVLDQSSKGSGEVKKRDRPMSHPLTVRKPMIAAINGGCAGIGLVQALFCDLRFAAAGVNISTAFTQRGLPAEFGSGWVLTRLIGPGHAMDLLLSSRRVRSEEALEIGLVNRVFPKEDLVAKALEYAQTLARDCSPVAMAAVKAQLAADWHRTHRESLDEAVALVADPSRRADFKEGVASYIDKRPPAFRPLPRKGDPL